MAHAFANTLKTFKTTTGKTGQFYSLPELARSHKRVERLPGAGRASVLVANHASYLDGLVLLAVAVVAFMLAVSGPLAQAVGDAIGAGEVALTAWNIGRWPIVLIFVFSFNDSRLVRVWSGFSLNWYG